MTNKSIDFSDPDLLRKLGRDAKNAIKSTDTVETGMSKRKTYSEKDATNPLALNGHEFLSFTPMDYKQKNNQTTQLVLSPFARLTVFSRSKLDGNTPPMSQLASRDADEYLSLIGMSFLIEQFGYDAVYEKYGHETFKKFLDSVDDIQIILDKAKKNVTDMLLHKVSLSK